MTERLESMGDTPLQVAGCLVFDELGRLLLLKRHPDDFGGGKWGVPGGKQEPDEDPTATVMREIFEETGITIEAVEHLGIHEIHMPHGLVHMKTFRATVPEGTPVTVNPEEHEMHRWFELSELVSADDVIWALPTTLRDFGLMKEVGVDPTLADGSTVLLLTK
ncbi:MAG TPA: NUDIX hydrolase [Candidatus Saccharimonadales bacterium]|nr:NUDIX hydrolase [Candidatus Saccharimonadales bacterium]